MATRPGFIWSGTEWVAIGQEAAVAPVSYQATEPTSPATGDIWIDSDDEVPGITSSLNYRWRKIATGGETSLSGNDTSGLPLTYNPGYEQVYLNGVLLYRGSDYVATTGNTITGLTALVANDTIEVLSFVTAPIGDTYGQAASDAKFVSAVNNGMFLVKKQTIGSGVTSVTVTNAFSSTYNAYKVIIAGATTQGGDYGYIKFGASGASYYAAYSGVLYSGTQSNATANNAALGTYAWYCDSNQVSCNIDIINPFLAKYTTWTANFAAPAVALAGGGVHKVATSYTDLVMGLNGGDPFTGGTIYVYGYGIGQ